MSSSAPVTAVFSKSYRAWMLTVLVLINALNLADRQSIAVTGQTIKVDLNFTDSELGLLQGLPFALFYTLMGLPLARLAEHYSRTRIIAGCLALFGAMAATCSTAHSFWRLLLCRVGVGIGDGGFGPPVASLVGDHYPMGKRASAMSVIWLGAPIGVVVGATVAGWLAEHVSWRAAFASVGATALAVAGLAALTLKEPPRGTFDAAGASGPPPAVWTVFKFLFAKRSVRHILVGCALAATSMNAIGQFLSPFLQRNYHMGPAEAGRLLALIAGAAMASGLALGGFGVDWAGRADRRWYAWGPAVGLALAAPLFLLGFSQSTVPATVVIMIAAHVSMFVYYAPTLAMAQNMVGANMRASSAFVVSFVLGLVGIGLGPTIVGFLSDRFARAAFMAGPFSSTCPGGRAPAGSAAALADACRDASALGIRHALMVMSLLCLWAALHYLLAARNLRRDLETHYEGNAGAPATSPAAT
jgi:predicted MFS family arabinose efflux permease